MIHTYQAIINQQGFVQLLQPLVFEESKRAILIVFDNDVEDSFLEKSASYILSESSLEKDWKRPEEDEAWEYLNQAN